MTTKTVSTPLLSTTNGNTDFADVDDQARFEADKRAVYKHPLFPLLALLFEKCEMATRSAECPSSDSFNSDIEEFVTHQEKENKPFFSDDPEVDNLMIRSIQVLRIHLLELEKVQELCKDFCHRYITCLKNKMQSENLLRSEYTNYQEVSSNSPSSDSDNGAMTPNDSSNNPVTQVCNENNGVAMVETTAPGTLTLQPGQIVSGGTIYQMVQTPEGIFAQPIQQIETASTVANTVSAEVRPTPKANSTDAHIVHGSTPLSQIGINTLPVLTDTNTNSTLLSSDLCSSEDDEDDPLGKRKQKRGILPKHATSIMRTWLFQHIVHPYPTEDEKKQISGQTNLTLLQVNNWFINARRRILQPMLDASNPDASHKAKRSKTHSTRPVLKFWPNNIASLQAHVANTGNDVDGDNSRATNFSENPSSVSSSASLCDLDRVNENESLDLLKGGGESEDSMDGLEDGAEGMEDPEDTNENLQKAIRQRISAQQQQPDPERQ